MSRCIYRYGGGDVIAPLDEPARDLLFGGLGAAAWLHRAAVDVGLSVRDVEDVDVPLPADAVAVVRDDVIINGAALAHLLAGAGVARAALATQTALGRASARLTGAGAHLDVPLWTGAVAGRTIAALVADAAIARVAVDDAGAAAVDVRPYGRPPHQLALADVDRLLLWPRHWLHVLDGGLAALRARLRTPGPRRAVERARRPRVHPTALVHNSVLGDGVVVEAHASVIDSAIGDDVIVADHSVVHSSAIGPGCRTLVDTHLRRVIAMGGSTLSNLDMQDAVFGREVFLTTGVAFFQDILGQDVVVDGHDSGRPVLGGAIGRRAVLGSRALMVAGCALPAGALIVARLGEAVGKLDESVLARANIRLATRADV